MQTITHSRQDVFKRCRKRHWFAYEQGIRKVEDAKALRMGSAFHDAIEVLANTESLDKACSIIHSIYEYASAFDELELAYERETVLRLVCGYQWYYSTSDVHYIEKEKSFSLSLLNPKTGHPSKLWTIAGKIDGIVLIDGRLSVIEHKLLSEDLDYSSDLWRRMRIDHQITLYVYAARRLGYKVESVFYDVVRKPNIKPSAIPHCDQLGFKIVLDKDGRRVTTAKGLPRQTGSSEEGYVLQTRPMKADEWGEKLTADIIARPEFYFARREIARIDQDIDEYESELWDIAKSMRDAQLYDRHFRTCNKDTCAWCPYFEICSSKADITKSIPEGFVRLSNVHPELKGNLDVNNATAAASASIEDAIF